MITNYIKIAWRNLVQNKTYTVINILGLTVGMTCCILIALYIHEELNFDSFNKKADRIAAIGTNDPFLGRQFSTPYPLAEALKNEVPEVENAVHLNPIQQLRLSPDGETYWTLDEGQYTEPEFFDLFSFGLSSGSPQEALASPNSVVLTKQSSRQLFGNENPVGRSLFWQQRDTVLTLLVTGVAENVPRNSSIQFDALVSLNTLDQAYRELNRWSSLTYQTFALLHNPVSQVNLSKPLQRVAKTHYKNSNKNAASSLPEFFSMPLSELHLSDLTHSSGFTGNSSYVYLFGSVALLILIIAYVNYINLATARISLRAKEVGIRKTLGAQRLQITGQFLGESVMLSIPAFMIGVGITELALPFFNDLIGTSLQLTSNAGFLFWLLGGAIFVGLCSGLYPALYLSGFLPFSVLRTQLVPSGSGTVSRKTLVVVQFVIALTLIVGSLVILKQLRYVETTDLGFNGDQVITVPLADQNLWKLRAQIRNELSGQPGIKQVSVASSAPSDSQILMGIAKPSDISSQAKVPEDIGKIPFYSVIVDHNYMDLLQIKLLAGRTFPSRFPPDKEEAYILNKKGAEELGWTPQEAIGKPFYSPFAKKEGKVIGVVENFHIESMHKQIRPVVLQLITPSFSISGTLLARLDSENVSESVNLIKKEIRKYAPYSSFNYGFLDQKIKAMYRTDKRFGELIGIFTTIAIVVACLGLYGLVAFATERRINEIGIRKVLGATVTQIVGLLSKDFMKLVLIGFVIAVPIAWYAMHRWLQNFAYKIEIGPGIFLLAGGVAVLIALATVSWQSIRAALANPVESLRSE